MGGRGTVKEEVGEERLPGGRQKPLEGIELVKVITFIKQLDNLTLNLYIEGDLGDRRPKKQRQAPKRGRTQRYSSE